MNIELMRIVERAVRPVQAGQRTKLRMREDLYQQIDQIHREECGTQEDLEAALAATRKRFGDPSALQRELQATVSVPEQFQSRIDDWITTRRPGESSLRYAIRLAVAMCLLVTLATGICFGFCEVALGNTRARIIWPFLAMLGPIFAANTFLIVLCGQFALRTFQWDKRRIRLVNRGRFAAACTVVGATLAISMRLLWYFADPQYPVGRLAGAFPFAAVTGIVLFLVVLVLSSDELEQRRRWDSLRIENE